MSAYFTIISAKEQSEPIKQTTLNLLCRESGFSVKCCDEEVYWKDERMTKISIKFDSSKRLPESEWIRLFHGLSEHHDIFRDSGSLEISHYSSLDSINDPFIVLYIPIELVKYMNLNTNLH